MSTLLTDYLFPVHLYKQISSNNDPLGESGSSKTGFTVQFVPLDYRIIDARSSQQIKANGDRGQRFYENYMLYPIIQQIPT